MENNDFISKEFECRNSIVTDNKTVNSIVDFFRTIEDKIEIENKNGKRVNAKSFIKMMGLDIKYGYRFTLYVYGADRENNLKRIEEILEKKEFYTLEKIEELEKEQESEGNKFIEEERTTMDDGKDFYAPQSIAGIEQNIVIGWINDMAHQFIKHPDKVNGMMSLPRLLTWNESGFTSYPIDSAANLFGPELPHSNEYKTNGSYLLRLTKTAKTVLAASEKGLITAEITEDGYGKIEIFGEVFKYGSERHKIHEISVFFDVEVFEIFINHGENAITRRFQVNYPEYDIRLISGNPSAVSLRPYKPS